MAPRRVATPHRDPPEAEAAEVAGRMAEAEVAARMAEAVEAGSTEVAVAAPTEAVAGAITNPNIP